MVIKLIDTDGDPVYVDPSLVAVIGPLYIDNEKTDGSVINVRTGVSCMRICIDEKPEQVAYLVNNAKVGSSETVASKGLTKTEEAYGE